MRWLRAGAAISSAALTLFLRNVVVEQRDAFPDEVDVSYLPPAEYLRPMSLGYREALADLVWLRALAFAGDHVTEDKLPMVERYRDAIVGLSPRFHRIYAWSGIISIYGGARLVSRPMVDLSIDSYRRGLAEFPESHELLYPLGMLLLHQVPSTPGYSETEKEASKLEGIEVIRKAAAFGADTLVRRYASTLVSRHATNALARQFLLSQLALVGDDEAEYRRALLARLSQLGDTSASDAQRIGEHFRAAQRKHAPYVPEALFVLVGDPATVEPRDSTSASSRKSVP